MNSILVNGGTTLCGAVKIQGSKNATLPILAASLLTKDCNFFENCPKITDVYQMIEILECFGCRIRWEEKGLYIDSSAARAAAIPARLSSSMRSTVFLLGALLGAHKEASLCRIGGCVIGERSINYHVDALTQMGTSFCWKEERMMAAAPCLHGAYVKLPGPSVGATENVILAAVCAEGRTCIEGAAREPEIEALCRYLKGCGARIEGAGTDCIVIDGVERLRGIRFALPADRIVAGTYLFAAAAAGGTVFLQDAPWEELSEPVRVARKMGAVCHGSAEGIYVQGAREAGCAASIVTGPYPAFPTDLQSAALVANCVAKGQCTVQETIFENRFRVVDELCKMGADIRKVNDRCVEVRGVERLLGQPVEAKELRGAAALVAAGLCAKGTTCIRSTSYLYRGYENISRDLRELGARVASV